MKAQEIKSLHIQMDNNCDSRVPSQCTEQACRHRISSQDRFFRMEASPLSVPKNLRENWKAINRPLCFQGVSPACNKCGLKERSIQCSNKCILNNLEQGVLLCIPSFLPNNTVMNKIEKDKSKKLVSITPCWQTQLWYPQILNMLIRKLVILPLSEKLLTRFVTNQTLTLVAWMVSGDICLRKEFLSRQPILSPTQGDRVHYQITTRPGRSGLAGVIGGQLIHSDVL